jgi:hypothetical protein
MRTFAVMMGAALVASRVATAASPESTGAPSLDFRSIPLEASGQSEHRVVPYRLYDKFVVTVWDPVACGQKAINATFSIAGEKLMLGYSLTPASAGAGRCTLVSEFDVSNVPHRDMEVHFAGGPEPYTIAKMKQCPSYSPKDDDIYECLMPAGK